MPVAIATIVRYHETLKLILQPVNQSETQII
jgi:hypothetical protein